MIPFAGLSGFYPYNAYDIGTLNPSDTIKAVLSWSNAASAQIRLKTNIAGTVSAVTIPPSEISTPSATTTIVQHTAGVTAKFLVLVEAGDS